MSMLKPAHGRGLVHACLRMGCCPVGQEGPDRGRRGRVRPENRGKQKFAELARLVGKRLVRHVGVLGGI